VRTPLCLALTSALLSAGPGAADDAKGKAPTDQEQIQGAWACESAELGGKPMPPEHAKKFKFTFKGDRLTIASPAGDREGTFRLDPGKKPRQLTIKPRDRDGEVKAIYALDGKSLKICAAGDTGEARPAEFATTVGERRILFVFRREKP
jgi:uncharacterized protein (TIGR03067 family)